MSRAGVVTLLKSLEMQKLHLILSCTARKRGSESGYPQLRSVGKAPTSDRVKQWATLLSGASRRYVAADLYAGEYWCTGKELVSLAASAAQLRVSVVSAGLGLIGIHDKVPMYGATFSARHPDSVLAPMSAVVHNQGRRQWWDELTRAEVLGGRGPQRVVEIEQPGSSTRVIVCLGRNYLEAIAADLRALVECLGDPQRVMIFASGVPLRGLDASWVSVSGGLRLILGGSSSSTTLRTAMAVFEELGTLPPSVDEARAVVTRLTAKAGELPSFNRRRQSDQMILDWILEYLRQNPSAAKTPALRLFRDGGNACNQARFGQLFNNARQMAT